MELRLAALEPGARARLSEGPGLPELERLGMTPGTRVRCLRRCPLGGPVLYEVRGAVLALRRSEAARIPAEAL